MMMHSRGYGYWHSVLALKSTRLFAFGKSCIDAAQARLATFDLSELRYKILLIGTLVSGLRFPMFQFALKAMFEISSTECCNKGKHSPIPLKTNLSFHNGGSDQDNLQVSGS